MLLIEWLVQLIFALAITLFGTFFVLTITPMLHFLVLTIVPMLQLLHLPLFLLLHFFYLPLFKFYYVAFEKENCVFFFCFVALLVPTIFIP